MAGDTLYACKGCRTVFALARTERTIQKQCPSCGRRTAHVRVDG